MQQKPGNERTFIAWHHSFITGFPVLTVFIKGPQIPSVLYIGYFDALQEVGPDFNVIFMSGPFLNQIENFNSLWKP